MSDFIPIRVNTLRGDLPIDFEVHIKINDKFILYLHEGNTFEGSRLKRLKEKKLKKMYIRPEAEAAYQQYVHQNIESAYTKADRDIQTRAEIIQGQQQANVEEVFENPDKEAAYNSTRDDAAKYVQFLLKNDGALPAVLKMDNTDKSISHHGVNVATLCVAMAKKNNQFDGKTLELLSLGALLHDFGHQHAQMDIAKPLQQMLPKDLEIYKKHPTTGAELVQTKKHFDQLVINIIAQHEECIDGSGYPNKLLEKDVNPAITLVSSANAIDRLVSFEGVPRKDVAKRLLLEQVGKHPLPQIQALSEILKSL